MQTNNHFGYMKIHFIDSNNLSVATVHVITHNFQKTHLAYYLPVKTPFFCSYIVYKRFSF